MRWLGWIAAMLVMPLACAACSPQMEGQSQTGVEPGSAPEAIEFDGSVSEPPVDRPQKIERPRQQKNEQKNEQRNEQRKKRGVLVTRAIDGDTVEVRLGGRIVDIRLIGIDTPESVAPGQPVECYGTEASTFTARQLEGERVRLTYDVERKDHYGRTLAYLWNGGMFNLALVRAGYATAYPYEPNTQNADRFAAAERVARAHDRGLWGACGSGGGGSGGASGGSGGGGCDPSYRGVCIPTYPPDLDCSQIPESNFKVQGSDPHGFDGNHDGRGCES